MKKAKSKRSVIVPIPGPAPYYPKPLAGEVEAVKAVVLAGRRFGFGNLIAHLQRAWALHLVEGGLSEGTAIAATQGRTPYPLHEPWFTQFDEPTTKLER